MIDKYKQDIWKLRRVKTQSQVQEGPTHENGLSASKLSLEGKHMKLNSPPALGKGKKYFMRDMQKLAVDVTFTQMTAKKGIKKHGKRAVEDMYK